MRRHAYLSRVVLTLLLTSATLFAQDDDEGELQPGLRWKAAVQGRSVERIDPDPVLRTGQGSVDERLPPNEPTHGRWTGQLLIRSEGTHQFHAFVSGRFSVRLNDAVVAEGSALQPQWISGPKLPLDFGEFPLVIDFESVPAGGELRLYWSSDTFPIEPLPFHSLFHEPKDQQIRQEQLGRDALEAFRCQSCHATGSQARPFPGPSLKRVGAGTSAAWLKERLTRATPDSDGRMPAFGFSPEDADAILAYLGSRSELAKPPKSLAKITEKDRSAGEQLVLSVGCLACHEWKGLGRHPMLGGGRLDDVAQHRSAEWLLAQLTEPTVHNAASRMPVFALTIDEQRQIVGALTQDAPKSLQTLSEDKSSSDQLIARGKALIVESRCAACHDLPGIDAPFDAPKTITAESLAADRGCFARSPDMKTHRPVFEDRWREPIKAYLTSLGAQAPSDLSAYAMGARLLDSKGCLSCHDRDGSRGISALTKGILGRVSAWEGQSPTLVPPSLTAVGDRLQDAALAKGVRGELPRRMDWLKVRMPKFRHTAAEAAALTEFLVAHDRIPEGAPASPEYPTSHGQATPETLLAGRELTGGKGFSCVACHALKDYVPPKVALGTRGSDLYRLGERMREPYFFRWVRSPLRILPGVEMPSYQRPHPTLLAGDINRQLAAIWDALHDPQFTAPTNPAVVEQLWGPSPDGRARVLRDVVTLTDTGGKYVSVPRAFAVGLSNRHSVLFDLEHGCVRSWTIGDFARQRTQGKSWFWDMAGVPVAADFPLVPDLYLVDERTQELVASETGWQPQVRLIQWKIEVDGSIRFRYELSWSRGEVPPGRTLLVYERWRPAKTLRGWERGLGIDRTPVGHAAWFRRPMPAREFGKPRFDVAAGSAWKAPIDGAPEGLRLAGPSETADQVWLSYLTDVTPPVLETPAAPPMDVPSEAVTCVPGFTGSRLPLPRSIMPTAMTWREDELVFTSLKGHVFAVRSTSPSDPAQVKLVTLAEGLAAPFGVTTAGDDLLVAHKPEVLKLSRPTRGQDGNQSEVVATGWGYTDDYHDWTCGIVRDSQNRYYVGLGSDYAHKNRPARESRWRGHILRFDFSGHVEPIASGLRYPVGFAMDDQDRLFVSDQQGVQNCFNEIDFIQTGHRYGVPAKLDPRTDEPADVAAMQVPHPWTRSVNGLCAWPKDSGHPFAGQIVGAEYNHRFLIRASIQEVDGGIQGGVYPLSKPGETNGIEEFLGPICVAFAPNHDLYVGSIHDSGWLGGLNTGDIVRLTPNDRLPNGIREIRATSNGFDIEFLKPVDPRAATDPKHYGLSGATRVWQGEYATPDSGRHSLTVTSADLSEDGKTVRLTVEGRKPGHLYDISVGDVAKEKLWPNTGYYTLNRIPK